MYMVWSCRIIFNIKGKKLKLHEHILLIYMGIMLYLNLFIKPFVCIHGHDKENVG